MNPTKTKNKPYIIGQTSFPRFAAIIVIGQKIKPKAIPSEMLYVNGIPNKIKKEGIAISISFHLILLKDCAIKTPTIINAGAVTCEVTTANKGENSKLKINKIPVVIAVIP